MAKEIKFDQEATKSLLNGVNLLADLVKVTFHAGSPVGIELPASVTLEVTQTDPGIRGDSVSNVFKPATLETGLERKVPNLIDQGERIRVDTRTGEFMERA